MCVQRFDDSLTAIHITYRISLRSSSSQEPRYPLPKVILGSSVRAGPELRRLWVELWLMLRCYVGIVGRPFGPQKSAQVWDVGLDRVVMILPQVHLRKPCYDFTFL